MHFDLGHLFQRSKTTVATGVRYDALLRDSRSSRGPAAGFHQKVTCRVYVHEDECIKRVASVALLHMVMTCQSRLAHTRQLFLPQQYHLSPPFHLATSSPPFSIFPSSLLMLLSYFAFYFCLLFAFFLPTSCSVTTFKHAKCIIRRPDFPLLQPFMVMHHALHHFYDTYAHDEP